jgi:RNA polymerase sigma-70 factor (ECF subfamily)
MRMQLQHVCVGAGSGAVADVSTSRRISGAVERAQLGDREALGFLYARYSDDVYGYVMSIVRDCHEAEDVTQQVFAKLIRVIGKYEQREVPFLAWVLRVARNVAVDHVRLRRPVFFEEVRASDEGDGDPSSGQMISDFRDAMLTLPLDQREILLLRHLAGYSPPEIATHTGRSEGAIHGLHHRARRALRAELTSRGAVPMTCGARSASRSSAAL